MKFSRDKWTTLVVTLLIAAIPAFCIYEWSRGPRPSAQLIAFPDGSKYRFAGVSVGTNHLPPVTLQRVSAHLPGFLANLIEKSFGKRSNFVPPERSATPELHVWLEQLPETAAFVSSRGEQAVLADEKGVEGSQRAFLRGTKPWQVTRFGMVPRRSRMLELHFYPMLSGGTASGPQFGKLRTHNPFYGEFPQWTPEPVPAARIAGDVNVQLKRAWIVNLPGIPTSTSFEFKLDPPTNSDAQWAVQRIEVCDATGNQLAVENAWGVSQRQFTVDGAFWPDEKALRLKVYLKRTAAFAANELVTFTNAPLPKAFATNGTSLTNRSAGCVVVLQNFAANYGMGLASYQYTMILPDCPQDITADFVKLEKDSGGGFGAFGTRSSDHDRGLLLNSLPPGAKSLNITVAVQKMRTVEFLVKPQ